MATGNLTAIESRIMSGPAPPSATPRLIDSRTTNLGQCENLFAMVTTPDECAAFLAIVQADHIKRRPPATVTAYSGTQSLDLMSRDFSRIIHEPQTLPDALLNISLPRLFPTVIVLRNAPDITGQASVVNKES